MGGKLRYIVGKQDTDRRPNERQPLLDHLYFTKVLVIPEADRNRFLERITKENKARQSKFLNLVTKGFAPISQSSPQAFGRLVKLADDTETRKMAKFIYEVELGLRPLVKNAPHVGIPHTEQFRILIESLVDGIKITMPKAEKYKMLRELNIPNATLAQTLAYCYVIEAVAGPIINYFQDFVAQWQVLTERSSELIKRVFLDEHNLTEGNLPEQHSGMVERMQRPYLNLVGTKEYEDAIKAYNEAAVRHLDEVYREIVNLVFR